jgi:copper resistance protein B
MGHCTRPSETASEPQPPAASTCTPEHAAMGHCTLRDPHAGHSSGTAGGMAPAVAPPPREALSGPAHAADAVYGAESMANARAHLAEEHGGMETSKFLVDQLEIALGHRSDSYAWDAQFWYGGDIDKLWLKTEGKGAFGDDFEGAELQALWSHAIDPWFDLQAGVRQDAGSGPDRTYLVIGAQGLAPYWFELDGALFLSTKGDISARIEAEYDLRLTQSWILQPRLEADFSLQDVPELGLGSGLTTSEVGARLRYEIRPEQGPGVIAPYVGLQYQRAFGRTADFRRSAGEPVGGVQLLLGVRTWF